MLFHNYISNNKHCIALLYNITKEKKKIIFVHIYTTLYSYLSSLYIQTCIYVAVATPKYPQPWGQATHPQGTMTAKACHLPLWPL